MYCRPAVAQNLTQSRLANDNRVRLVHPLSQQHEHLESAWATPGKLADISYVSTSKHGEICGVFLDLFQVNISVRPGEHDVQYI